MDKFCLKKDYFMHTVDINDKFEKLSLKLDQSYYLADTIDSKFEKLDTFTKQSYVDKMTSSHFERFTKDQIAILNERVDGTEVKI